MLFMNAFHETSYDRFAQSPFTLTHRFSVIFIHRDAPFPFLTPFITMLFTFCSFSNFPTFGPVITSFSTFLFNRHPRADNVESLLICSAMCLSFVTTLISSMSMYFICLFLNKVFTIALLKIVDFLLSTMATAHSSPI